MFGLDQRPDKRFGINPRSQAFFTDLIKKNKAIITWFGNPYGIDMVPALREAGGLILAYQENDYTGDLAAQLIFGGIGAKGTLPVTINDKWPYNFGLSTQGNLRLKYGYPENGGLSSTFSIRELTQLQSQDLIPWHSRDVK